MTWTNWTALAIATAEYARANLSHVPSGTIRIDLRDDGPTVIAYFGNEIEDGSFRTAILQSGAAELAFARSEDGGTWCMLVAPRTDVAPVIGEEQSECTISI